MSSEAKAEARKHIRGALALCEEELPNAARVAKTLSFEEEIRVPAAARKAIDRALLDRKEAAEKEAEAMKSAASGAKALRRAGLSLRDAGELLGLSHQRIKQLTAE